MSASSSTSGICVLGKGEKSKPVVHKFLFFSLFSQQVILSLQLFVCAYNLDKQQTVQNTYNILSRAQGDGISNCPGL
jgi:hypothetical protein